MPRLVHGYVEGLEHSVASLYNNLLLIAGIGDFAEPLVHTTVKEWLVGEWGKGFAAVLEEGVLHGYQFTWRSRKDVCPVFIVIRLNPLIPKRDQYYAGELLLAWSRYLLETSEYQCPMAILSPGFTAKPYLDVLESIAPCTLQFKQPTSYLMVSWKPLIRRSVPRGYRIRAARPHIDPRDAKAVSKIYNDAFKAYSDYDYWSPIDAMSHYARLFARKAEAIVYIAETAAGEPVGFIESYTYLSLTGRKIGYHSLLGVREEHRGRGVGSALLSTATQWLRTRGVEAVVLEAEPPAYNFYVEHGFRPVSEAIGFKTYVECLPSTPVHGVIVSRV